MSRMGRAAGILTAAVLTLTGCGGPAEEGAAPASVTTAGATGPGTAPTGAPAQDDPAPGAGTAACDLLTVAEVGELFGVTATVDDKIPAGSTKECLWAGRAGAMHQLHLQVYTGTSYFSPARWGGTAAPVTGLGDEAFLVRSSPLGTTAGTRDGERVVFLNYQILLSADARPADRADAVTDLLRTAVGRF